MANALTAFTPIMWAQESIAILRERVVSPRLVRRDFSAELAQAGDVVNTRKPGKMTAGDVDDTNGVTPQDVSATNVAVTLSNHKHATFRIKDREASRSFQNLVKDFLDPAMLAVANAVDKSVLGLYTDVTTIVDVSSHAGWKDGYNKARTKLNKQLAPDAPRVAILSDDDEGDVSNLDILNKVNESGSNETLRKGSVGEFKGFQTYRSSNVSNVGSPGVRHNLFFHPNAFALVVRPLSTATGQTFGVAQMIATDPDAGLALRVTMSYNATLLATQVTVDLLYGVQTLDKDLAVVLRCSLT